MTAPIQIVEIDCRGMRCPAPILAISKAARSHRGVPSVLRILADDGDFPRDLKAWCRSTSSNLLGLSEQGGEHQALLGLNGVDSMPEEDVMQEQAHTPPAPQPVATSSAAVEEIDCLGMKCPAPILHLSKAARRLKGTPSVVRILADDADFPRDMKAWCRSTGSEILSLESSGSQLAALISLEGGRPAAASAPAAPTSAAPAADSVLDLRGKRSPVAFLMLGQALLARQQPVRVVASAGSFQSDIYAWAAATRAQIAGLQVDGGEIRLEVSLDIPTDELPAAAPAAAPALPAVAPQPQLPAVTRENRATLLVLHNDMESLLAAMMVANTSAAQGMDVMVYFSFWGVNLLRGDAPRAEKSNDKPNIIQKMMKWMMPKGPDRQGLSQMNMGGAGPALMKWLMRKQNVNSLREMMQDAISQDVRFVVCTMSMGILGVQKQDLMELPNMEFGGVTSFVESAGNSRLSLGF